MQCYQLTTDNVIYSESAVDMCDFVALSCHVTCDAHQVVSGGVSQADSEEEWKVLPSGSSAEKSEEGSPKPVELAVSKETTVFMAGGRVSLVCVCVCV